MKKNTIKTLDGLVEHQFVATEDLPELEKVIDNFSLSITEQMHQLIDKQDPHDPIAKQFIPSPNELDLSPNELDDPIGDKAHTTVKGIIHRYPDRCLFTPVHVCPIYCRFCFRREKVGTSSETLNPEEIEAAINYIESHKEIWEVILTGGDPLILKPVLLKRLIDRLNSIDHVAVIRIHTRVPVVESHRINAELIAALKIKKPVYVVLHANHPKEFTPEAKEACSALVDAGFPMLSQSTLLKGVNDTIEVLSELMRCFITLRIKPYYLHQSDLVKGTKHFRTSIIKGQELMAQLRGRFSGLCQPTYVLDIPKGHGKIPIGPNYISCLEDKAHYLVEDYQGKKHYYPIES